MKRRWWKGSTVDFDTKFIYACECKYRFSLIEVLGVLAPFAVLFGAMCFGGHQLWMLFVHVVKIAIPSLAVLPTTTHAIFIALFGAVLCMLLYLPMIVLALPWCVRWKLWLLRRKGAPICVYCSYDMSGLGAPQCPECGHVHRSTL